MSNSQTKAYAGFWRRLGAFALDYVIILLYLAAITLLLLLVNSFFGMNEWLFAERVRAQVSAFLLVTLPVTLYFAFSESSARQASWGKRRIGLKVIDTNGNRIGVWRSLARTLLKFIPWELSHTLIWEINFQTNINPTLINIGFVTVYGLTGLNLASFLFSKTRQTLYDFIAGTRVEKLSG